MGSASRLRGLAAALLTASALAPAAPPGDAPTRIEADRAEFDDRTGVSVYRGNVRVTRADLRLAGDRLTVHGRAGRLVKAVMEGEPATFHQARAEGPPIDGEARRIEYDADEQRVVLIDDARLEQGPDRFSGARIVCDLATERVQAEGAGEDDRVQVIMHPKTDNGANDGTGDGADERRP